jgi:diphthine-ammonia ligase
MKLAALFSGGKDSVYAVHYARQQGYDVTCLLTMVSKNKESYMYHTLKVDRIPELAKSMGIKLYEAESEGVKEEEVDDLMEVLEELKEKEGIEGVVSGALASDYQKTRIERVCEELGLASMAPMWHVDPEAYMGFLIKEGFDVRVAGVFADGLDESWVGRKLDGNALLELKKLHAKNGISIAGEGGEYETYVMGAPGFINSTR